MAVCGGKEVTVGVVEVQRGHWSPIKRLLLEAEEELQVLWRVILLLGFFLLGVGHAEESHVVSGLVDLQVLLRVVPVSDDLLSILRLIEDTLHILEVILEGSAFGHPIFLWTEDQMHVLPFQRLSEL